MKHLILGGARSGKSSYAESLALSTWNLDKTRSLYYVATAQALDHEMTLRIQHHLESRHTAFETIEESLALAEVLETLPSRAVVVVDCLTLWLSNILHNPEESITERKKALFNTLRSCDHEVYLVSNEISLGVTPMGEITRKFVDEMGWLHQELGQTVDELTLMVAGIPTKIK